MSVCRKLPDGTIQKIAGHTILLDANASEVRTGAFNITGGPAGWVEQIITFSDPMPDTDYVVVLECNTQNWGGGENSPGPFRIHSKSTTGFVLSQYNTTGAAGFSFIGTYTAWKPVKIEGYTELQNKVNNPDNTPTIDSMNLVTSDGVARAIENASAVWKGTKAEWNALPATTKIKYDLAVLLDQTLVKAIDRTDGTETNVADLSGQFVGTHAEWEAETNKTQYKTAVLTDDRKTVNEVTGTGALNEVADDARIWRGTKEEWNALSAAEKDEWDQAEIETIEPKDMNPFRTLSDPETLSIAPNTDYTCPHDGFITIESHAGCAILVNGVRVGGNTADDSVTVPVQKGDVFSYTGSSTLTARWYTNEVSPGPTDTPVLYRSQALDWDNAVVIPIPDLSSASGWTAPGDGYVFIAGLSTSSGWPGMKINNKLVSYGINLSVYKDSLNMHVPVSQGDVIQGPISKGSSGYPDSTWFVPYKDYPDYSTTEHWTGRRWIDGKKIYSKVVQNPTSGLTIATNVEECIAYRCKRPRSQGQNTFFILYDGNSTSGTTEVYYIVDNENLKFYAASFPQQPWSWIYAEYTKTTDD